MRYAAVIVETRSFPDLPQIILQHMSKLTPEWQLFIFHGDTNKHIFENIKAEKINIGSLDTLTDYNHLLTSVTFWDYIPYSKVLIFQHDSMLIRKGIKDFLMWDYIGSPIPRSNDQNGGLSLRTREAMIEVIKNHPCNGPEDVYFSSYIQNKAPLNIASKFSCEMIFTAGTLGYHAIHKYLNQGQISFIKNQYNPSLFQGLR